ncbi:MAG: glutamate synthase-related protein [Parafilimonas sp.]
MKKKHAALPDKKNLNNNRSFSFSKANTENGLTVMFGNSYCSQPYLSSIFYNEAIYADQNSDLIQKTASLKAGNFLHAVNEFENDIIWQIKPGYPGCNTENFNFNKTLFTKNAMQPYVKMIELKLMPFDKENKFSTKKDIYSNVVTGNKYVGTNLQPAATHTAFSSAESMVIFLDSLRQLCGRKPVGIRMSITEKKDFHEICYAFRKTCIIPDYILIEDGATQNNSSIHSLQKAGMPLYEALLFVSKNLEMYGLENEIKIIAASPVHTAFDVLKLHALGADAISMKNAEGIETNISSAGYLKELRNKIIINIAEIMSACGYSNVQDITLPSLLQRFDFLQSKAFSEINNHETGRDIKRKIFLVQ